MKQFLFCLLALLTTIACTNPNDNGGSTDNPEPDKPKAELTLNVSSVDFTAEGGESEVSFVSSEAWSAEVLNDRADGWCSVTPTSGEAGEATIRITATANQTTDDRSASVIIKAGKLSKTVKVNQKQMDALTVTSSKFEVGCIGGEIQIEVKANIDFQYAIEESAKGWITYRQTRALKSSTLIFAVAENSNVEKREAKIYITHGELTEVVTIYQEGSKPTIVISKSEYVLSAGSETIAVEVKSNVDVAVELPADVNWIRESKSRATSTNTYYFEISANEQYDPRYAEIKFINKENNLSEVVKITQSQRDAIVIAKDSYTISSDGGDIQVEVGHNVEFDINIDCDWITRVATRAFASQTITFSIAENTTPDAREGTITFKSKDGKLAQTVKVYQEQKDVLVVGNKDITVSADSGTLAIELQTNVEFSVSEPSANWLRAVQTRALTNNILHYEYDANNGYESRQTQIVVTDSKNNRSETITITQSQKDAIVIAKDSYTIGSDGGEITVEVGHNIEFDINIDCSWITRVENTRAYQSEKLIFSVAAYTEKEDRSATITISSRDGKISHKITVVQTGYKAFDPSIDHWGDGGDNGGVTD